MDDPARPQRWRFRPSCLGLLGIGLACLAILIGIVLVWSSTTGDLEAVDKRARAMGLPLTWDEVGLVKSPPTVLDDWRRLMQLAASVTSYQSSTEDYWTPKVGEPIPEALRAHHVALPQAELAELLELCDRLRPGAVTVRTAYEASTLLPEIEATRNLAQLFNERASLVSQKDLLAGFRRHAALTMASAPQTAIQHLVAYSLVGIWAGALTRRLPDFTEREQAALLADEVRQWTASQAQLVYARDFLGMRMGVHDLANGKAHLTDWFGMMGGDVPEWVTVSRADRPVVRLLRRNWLETRLNLDQGWRLDAAPAARAEILRRHEAEIVAQSRALLGPWRSALNAYLGMIGWSWLRTDTHLAVLAAELRGQPWPTDPTDPTGGRVRPILRDGRVIGFYLLGEDGKDDGGKGDDKAFPLYEALSKP